MHVQRNGHEHDPNDVHNMSNMCFYVVCGQHYQSHTRTQYEACVRHFRLSENLVAKAQSTIRLNQICVDSDGGEKFSDQITCIVSCYELESYKLESEQPFPRSIFNIIMNWKMHLSSSNCHCWQHIKIAPLTLADSSTRSGASENWRAILLNFDSSCLERHPVSFYMDSCLARAHLYEHEWHNRL